MFARPSSFAIRVTRLGICSIVAVLVLVPTALRVRQHVVPRDTIRLGIKLNWNSDAPPSKATVDPPEPSPLEVEIAVAAENTLIVAVRPDDVPLPRSPLDTSPDPLRGPPYPVL